MSKELTKLNVFLTPTSVVLSAKLKLLVDQESYIDLLMFAEKEREMWNWISEYNFTHGKLSRKSDLQKLVYETARELFGLSSQVTISTIGDVAAKYKTLKAHKRNHEQSDSYLKFKKPFKGLNKPPKKTALSVLFQHKKDFTFSFSDDRPSIVSIQNGSGRTKMEFRGWDQHVESLKNLQRGGGTLNFDKKNKKVYLTATFHVPTSITPPEKTNGNVGIDVGIRNLAFIKREEEYFNFSGKKVKDIRREFLDTRTELQTKGTRSAKRRLIAIGGRERRFMRNENHVLGKIIANGSIGYGISVELLTGIREKTDPTHSKNNSKKQGVAKYNQTSWSFADLHNKLEYKAYLNGSPFIYVDPHRTSIRCPECRHEDSDNRPNGAKIFCCLKCGLKANSDAIGSSNIKENADIVILAGQLSTVPNVPNAGAPAPYWRDFWRGLFSAGYQSLLRTNSAL